MALSARSVSSFTSSRTVCSLLAAWAVRQRDHESGASGFEEVVDVFEFLGQELVVVAELEQLRVGILQQLDGGLGAGGRVVEKGGVPSDDREIVGIVRNARLQNLLALAIGEDGCISPRTTWAMWSPARPEGRRRWESLRSRGRGR